MSQKFLSIVTTVFNEKATIEDLVHRIESTMSSMSEHYDFEIILVDDGSKDSSLKIMKQMAKNDKRIRVIELRRNYGQTAALQAGLDSSRGEIIITLDADLQHFPEEIPQFLAKIDEGYDLVCGWRSQRVEGRIRRWPSRLANLMIKQITNINIHDFGTTFRAYRSDIIKELRLLGEFHRFLPALVVNMGGSVTEIPIQNIERQLGKSNYGIGRTFGVFLDILLLKFLTQYFDRPLRAFGKVGTVLFASGALILGFLVVYAYATGIKAVRERIGWFMISIMLLISSIQVLLAGILAEIMIRVYFTQEDRRVYRIYKEWNVDNL